MRLCNYRLMNAIVFLIKMLVECKYCHLFQDCLSRGIEGCNIVCTEPRRISATSLAVRVSQEMGETSLGREHFSSTLFIHVPSGQQTCRACQVMCMSVYACLHQPTELQFRCIWHFYSKLQFLCLFKVKVTFYGQFWQWGLVFSSILYLLFNMLGGVPVLIHLFPHLYRQGELTMWLPDTV